VAHVEVKFEKGSGELSRVPRDFVKLREISLWGKIAGAAQPMFGPQGREVGKLPGTFPSKEAEMREGAPPPAPAPQGGQTR